jgi:hypothetical protein
LDSTSRKQCGEGTNETRVSQIGHRVFPRVPNSPGSCLIFGISSRSRTIRDVFHGDLVQGPGNDDVAA